jgi:hypothetical protein
VGGKTLKKKSEGFVLEKVLEEDLGDSFLKLSLPKTLKGVYIKDHHESSEKLLHALLIIQISKEDYTDFPDFSMHFISV